MKDLHNHSIAYKRILYVKKQMQTEQLKKILNRFKSKKCNTMWNSNNPNSWFWVNFFPNDNYNQKTFKKITISKNPYIKIFSTNSTQIGGWHENSYEYQDSEKFDSYSFNNYVERKLDEIIEKIEDGDNEKFNIQDYLDMVSRVSKKFEIGIWHNLPKKKDVRFYIENFEMNPNKVIVKLSKAQKQRVLKLTEDNFYHLLYQPTLFNLEEI